MAINLAFSRLLLKGTMEVIKPLTTVAERKAARVRRFGLNHRNIWEFYGPDGFYWYGVAGNAYDARRKGWEAWREKLPSDQAQLRKAQ
jgi:hypothetical protein